MKIKVLIVPGNREELVDSLGLLKSLGLYEVTLLNFLLSVDDAFFVAKSVGVALNVVDKSVVRGVLSKTRELVRLLWLGRPDIVVVGAQLSFHRLAFTVKPKSTKVIVYNRGLLCDISKSPIISLRLLVMCPRFLRGIKLFNPYKADYSLVISDMNKEMLGRYGASNLFSVGLFPLADHGHVLPPIKSIDGDVIVVFATQAYSSHGLHDASLKQTSLIKKIFPAFSASGVSTMLKKHPRDNTPYSTIIPDVLVCVENSEIFIGQCKRLKAEGKVPVLLSSPSTFLAEWVNAGLQAILYKDKGPSGVYSNIYSQVELTGRLSENLSRFTYALDFAGLEYAQLDAEILKKIYSDVDLDKLRNKMVDDGYL